MRIHAHLPAYPPSSLVGAWLGTHRLLAGAVERGHEVDVTTYLGGGPRWAYVLDGVRVHPRCSVESLPTPDVMVAHLGDDGEASKWCASTSTPEVVMVHGTDFLNSARVRRRRPDLLVCNSRSLSDSITWPGRRIVCHPPVAIEPAPGPRNHVTLVNLAASKGGEVLREVAMRLPDTPFLGVYGGYGGQALDQPHNVEIHPPTHRMAAEVYGRTRVLLMPSIRETWGMVGVEAMACGVPVIAHPTPGLVESLGAAGIFCDRDDPDAWVEQIRRLDDPAEYEQASTAALRRSAELDPTPDLDRFTDALEALCSS